MKKYSFHFLWIGQLFANLGDVFYIVGLVTILYTSTESAFYLSILPFLNTFGRFISGTLSPILLNKFKLKSLLVYSQLFKTIVLLVLSCSISFQLTTRPWFIFICILLIAFLDGWAMPATNAMIPRLVEQSKLFKANSFIATVNQVVQLGGWALGGILSALLNSQNLIWFTFSLFVISTFMMQGIIDQTPFVAKDTKIKVAKVLKEGWVLIWKNPLFRSIHVLVIFESMANVVWIAAILYVFVTEVLHVNEIWWGYINTAFFIGLIMGGILCSKLSLKFEQNMRKTIIFSSIGFSVITFVFGLNSSAFAALILVAMSGLFDQVKTISMNTYLQKEATIDDLPKIYSAQNALVSLVFGISSLLFGAITEYISVQLAFIISGFLLSGSVIYLLVVRNRFSNNYLADRE